MSKRIIIAGGGTGGHIFPAVAVANALKKTDDSVDILFVGAKGKMEMEKVPQAGYEIRGIDIAGFNRSSLIKNIGLPFKVIKSMFQVNGILNKFKPHAVFGVGGYSSYPVLRMAQNKGIPTFLHESNAYAGKSNMLLGKKANKVFVAAPNMDRFFPADRIVVTGNPVRNSIVDSTLDAALAKSAFGLAGGRTTVFAMGGSLGAKSINEAIDAGLNQLLGENIQLIWQTGKSYIDKARASVGGKRGVWVSDFINDMASAYHAADIVISRARAMSVTELCIAGKPVIFVPYPHAAEDHQTANARALVDNTAAIMIKDDSAKERLIPEVVELSKDELKRNVLSANIKRHVLKDADMIIANLILQNIE